MIAQVIEMVLTIKSFLHFFAFTLASSACYCLLLQPDITAAKARGFPFQQQL
jgi:hypothetical protein